MSQSHAALALLFGLTSSPLALSGARLILSEVDGEVRIEAPSLVEELAPLPELSLGSRVSAVTGTARIESDLPATVWLDAGEAVDLLAAGPDPQSRRGIVIDAVGGGPVEVAAGPSRVILDPGDAIAVRRLASDLVGVESVRGLVELAAMGGSRMLEAGERLTLHAGAQAFAGEALDLKRVTTSRREQGSLAWITVRSPQMTVAQAFRADEGFAPPESDLRSAVGAKPAPAAPQGRRAWPEPSPRPEGAPGAVEPDRVVAAALVVIMLAAGWWWARRVV